MSIVPYAAFPELAIIGQEIILSVVIGLYLNTRSHTGWAVSGAALFLTYLWRVGFSIHNPLQLYPGNNNAYYMYFAIYPACEFAGIIIAYIVCVCMDIRPLVWTDTLINAWFNRNNDQPISETEENIPEEDRDAVDSYDALQQEKTFYGAPRGFAKIQPYYLHSLFGLFLILWNIVAPQLIYVYEFNSVLTKWGVLGIGALFKIIGYVLAGVFWSYRSALEIWGPTAWNIEERQKDPKVADVVDDDPETNATIYKRTQSTVMRNVITIAMIDLFGFLLVGFVTAIPSVPNVTYVWPIALTYILVVALIAVIYFAFFVFFANRKRDKLEQQQQSASTRKSKNSTATETRVNTKSTATGTSATVKRQNTRTFNGLLSAAQKKSHHLQ
jgi:hypothetical protein